MNLHLSTIWSSCSEKFRDYKIPYMYIAASEYNLVPFLVVKFSVYLNRLVFETDSNQPAHHENIPI